MKPQEITPLDEIAQSWGHENFAEYFACASFVGGVTPEWVEGLIVDVAELLQSREDNANIEI